MHAACQRHLAHFQRADWLVRSATNTLPKQAHTTREELDLLPLSSKKIALRQRSTLALCPSVALCPKLPDLRPRVAAEQSTFGLRSQRPTMLVLPFHHVCRPKRSLKCRLQ